MWCDTGDNAEDFVSHPCVNLVLSSSEGSSLGACFERGEKLGKCILLLFR